MAMWKKMADAFGRAVKDPGATQKGRDLVFESKTVKNRVGDADYHGDDTPAQRAFKRGMAEGEEEEGIARTGAQERYKGDDPDVRRDVESDEFERREDWTTDQRLEKDFDDAFKYNLKRRKQDIIDKYGEGYSKEMAEEGAESFERMLWEAIDELKADGKSGNEILDMLRVDKPKGPYGE